MRPIAPSSTKLSAYTHALEKNDDGMCRFLTPEKLCRLHQEQGEEAKPSMCRLFPYTFTPTPSGVYASISFASTGALYNSGRPLSEQRDHLESRFRLFEKLMPDHKPDWHALQLVDGVPLSWQTYIDDIEPALLSLFAPSDTAGGADFLERARRASAIVTTRLPAGFDTERQFTEARPIVVDQILLSALLDFLYPQNVYEHISADLPVREIGSLLVTPPTRVRITYGGEQISAGRLLDCRLGALPRSCEELLGRFVYCRIFSKLYFGPGYNNLSLIAGLHHLLIVVTLAKVTMKHKMAQVEDERQTLSSLAELIRTLERRLTVASLSRESTALLEVLITSPRRLERLLTFAL